MAHPNLAIRGSTYWWRRKVTVAGHRIPIALSVRTGNYLRSRGIAECLAVELEALRMAYGERGTHIDAATLKKIFNQAMRWQLERILSDQIGSPAPVAEHHAANRLYAELWRLHARGGPDAKYTADDDDRLKAADWPAHDRSALATLWEEARHGESRISPSRRPTTTRRSSATRTRQPTSIRCAASSMALVPLPATKPLLAWGKTTAISAAGWSTRSPTVARSRSIWPTTNPLAAAEARPPVAINSADEPPSESTRPCLRFISSKQETAPGAGQPRPTEEPIWAS